MQNTAVTRYAGGVTTARLGSGLENLKIPPPPAYHSIFSDFDKFDAADWVVTATGAAVESIVAGDGGILQLTNTAANGDLVSMQWAGGTGAVSPTFLFEANRDMVFSAAIQLDNANLAAFLVGLAIADTSPIASLPATGMFITKPGGTLFPQGYLRDAGTGTLTAQAQTPLANATRYDLSIVYSAYDGNCRMYVSTPLNPPGPADPPAAAFQLPTPLTLPGALLAPTIALANGSAAARNMQIDWFLAAKSRRAG